jgi:hypothetical protein
MQAWRRGRTGKVVADPKENSGTEREEDAETIAAYFELHGISSTALIAGTMDHVRTHLPFTCFHFTFFVGKMEIEIPTPRRRPSFLPSLHFRFWDLLLTLLRTLNAPCS